MKEDNAKLSKDIKPALKTIAMFRSAFARFVSSGTVALLAFAASLSQVWGKTMQDAFVALGAALALDGASGPHTALR